MVSRQHQNWINKGRPNSGLTRPLAQLRDLLRAAGYTVFDFPNDSHLDAQPPEDHTFYSETGWPDPSPKWWMHAIDIMPPPAGKHLPSLRFLGQRMFDDRQAGRITWLKYMNWPSDGDLSRAVQDRWKPNHSRSSSSDTGHIHLSAVTGVEHEDAPYNPLSTVVLAREFTKEDKMFLAIRADQKVFLCDGMRSRGLAPSEVGDLRTLVNEGLVTLANNPDHPRAGYYEGAFGLVDQPVPGQPAQLDDKTIGSLTARISAAVVEAVGHLTDDDKPAVEDAVKNVLG